MNALDSTVEHDVESPLQSSENTTDNSSDVSPTESTNDEKPENICASSIEELIFNEPSTSNGCFDDIVTDESPMTVSETMYVFSIDNVPNGCYYLSQPNKYVFPGSTYTWYGTGDPVKDQEIFEVLEDDDVIVNFLKNDGGDEDDYVEEKYEAEGNRDDSPISVENNDNDDVTAAVVQQNESAVLGKRVGELTVDNVSPVKQFKVDDENWNQ